MNFSSGFASKRTGNSHLSSETDMKFSSLRCTIFLFKKEQYLLFSGVGYLSTKCFVFFSLYEKSANRSYLFFPRLDTQSIFPGRFQQSLSLPRWQNLSAFTPR